MVSELLLAAVLASAFSCVCSIQDDIPFTWKPEPILVRGGTEEIKLRYYNSSELVDFLREFSKKSIARATYIGRRAQRADIYAVEIDRHANQHVTGQKDLLKPSFKFVANIHGDDAVGYALLVGLMQYLVQNDGYDERVTRIINTTNIYIVPTLNPRGFDSSELGRCDTLPNNTGLTNENGLDLDQGFSKRAFAYETETMKKFIHKNDFVLSGNLQGGALVASYPYDYGLSRGNAVTPDNKIFVKLAQDYQRSNPMISGVINGNAWKRKRGSMQDYNYAQSNCFEITLYLSNCKYPEEKYLPFYWKANLESMLKLIENTRLGLYGLVKNKEGRPVRGATIKVKGINKDIKGTNRGEYWRLLDLGTYDITVKAPGYRSTTMKDIQVTKEEPYVRQDFLLVKE